MNVNNANNFLNINNYSNNLFDQFQKDLQQISSVPPEFNQIVEGLHSWSQVFKQDGAFNKLCEAIINLPRNNEIWLPYSPNINICFKRSYAKFYEITVINVGQTKYHSSTISNGEQTFQASLVKKDVPISKLSDPFFIKLFINDINQGPSEEMLYEQILPYLSGKIDKSSPHFDKVGITDPKVKGLFAILRHKMRDKLEVYKNIKLEYRQNNIEKFNSYPHNPKLALNIRQQSKQLLKNSNDKYAHRLALIHNSVKETEFEFEEQDTTFFSLPPPSEKSNSFLSADPVNLKLRSVDACDDDIRNPAKQCDLKILKSNDPTSADQIIKSGNILSLPGLKNKFWEEIKGDQLIESWINNLSKSWSFTPQKQPLQLFFLQAIVTELAKKHSKLTKHLDNWSIFSRAELAIYAFSRRNNFLEPKDQALLNELLLRGGLTNFDPARDSVEHLDTKVIFQKPQHYFAYKAVSSISKDPIHEFFNFFKPGITSQQTCDILASVPCGANPNPELEPLKRLCHIAFKQESLGGMLYKKQNFFGKKILVFATNHTKDDSKVYNINNFNEFERLHFRPQNKYIEGTSFDTGLSYLASDRILRLISLINRQDSLISDLGTDLKRFLTEAFFQGPILQKTLIEDPSIAVDLLQMVKKALYINKPSPNQTDPRKTNQFLAYLSLTLNLKNHIKFAAKSQPELYDTYKNDLNNLLAEIDNICAGISIYENADKIFEHTKLKLIENDIISSNAKFTQTALDSYQIIDNDKKLEINLSPDKIPKIYLTTDNLKFELQNNIQKESYKSIWKSINGNTYLLERKNGDKLFYFSENKVFSDSLDQSKEFFYPEGSPLKLGTFVDQNELTAYCVNGQTFYQITPELSLFVENNQIKSTLHPGFVIDDALTKVWQNKLGTANLIALSNQCQTKILLKNDSSPLCYHEFDVVSLEDSHDFLRANGYKGQLGLIKNLIDAQKFADAEMYLAALSLIKGLDDEDIKLLQSLILAPETSPNHTVLKTKLMLELAKNLNFYRHESWQSLQQLLLPSLYQQYLNTKRFANIKLLSPEDELQIINFIADISTADKHMLASRARYITTGEPNKIKSALRPSKGLIWNLKECITSLPEIFTVQRAVKLDQEVDILKLNLSENFEHIHSIARYGSKEMRQKLKINLMLTKPEEDEKFKLAYINCLLLFPHLFPLLTCFAPVTNSYLSKINYFTKLPAVGFFALYQIFNAIFSPRTTFIFAEQKIQAEFSLESKNSLVMEIERDLLRHPSELSIKDILGKLNKRPTDINEQLKDIAGQTKNIDWQMALDLFLKGCLKEYKKANPHLSDAKLKEIDADIGRFLVANSNNRKYDINLDIRTLRHFLVFEYRSLLNLRGLQVNSLTSLTKSDQQNIVSQQGTGSGKSKVQLPLLQKLLQSGQNGIVNCWPAPLATVNSDDILSSCLHNFNQKAEKIICKRGAPKDVHSLHLKDQILKQAIAEQKQLSSTTEDMQSLELSLIELLYDLEKNEPLAKEESFYPLQSMLKTYRKAKVLVDESQATLNPTKELSYSMGNPEAEDEELVLFMAEIFACMLSPTVEKILQLKSNFQHKIAKEDFIAAAAIIAEQMAPNFNIKAEHRAEFLAYLQNSQLAAPKWLENSPNRAKIALLRGVICSLMQDCFYHKAIGTNYGCKDPTNTEGFAIPYSANNSPTFNSEYDITWETLLKTFHIYAHKNLKVEQALDLMLHLADRAKKESLEKGILLEETHEYQFIESLNLPNNDNLTNIDLSSKSLAILCQNDLFKLRYVAYLVAPDIRRYAEKATSTAQNMRSQFAEMITMSATPIDHKIYAPDPLFIADENESDRKVAKRLLDTAQNIFINESAPKKSLEQLINLTNNNQIRMLIDCGAMLKGLSNRFVAEQILNSSSHKGVLFFDQNEEMVVLEKGHKEPVPLSLSLLNPKDLFTYCDHKHIFGADTVQIEDAIGLCTVGVQTTYEEILQGAGRLRQLLVGQTAHFVTTTKDSTTEIFAKAKHNSKLEAEDKLFRAIKQQIHNEIRSRALSKILSCRTAKEALKIFAKTRQIFITKPSFDVWQLYGQKSAEISRQKALLNYLNKVEKEAVKLGIFNRSEKKELSLSLDKYRQIISKQTFTTKITTQLDNAESRSETHKELEKEVEVEVEKQNTSKYSFNLLREEKKWPEINLYQDNWLKCDAAGRSVIQTFVSLFNQISIQLLKLEISLRNRVINLIHSKIGGYWTSIIYPIYDTVAKIMTLPATKLNLKVKKRVSFYEASDLLKNSSNSAVKKIAAYFKPNKSSKILVTSNFMPIKDSISFIPFGPEQKLGYKILVIKENNRYTAIMGDQTTDVTTWKQLIKKQLKSTRQIFEYDLELNKVTAGFKIKDLETNKSFQEMLIKIKLINGDTNFTKYQLNILFKDICTADKADLLNNFIKQVTNINQEKKDKFQKSECNKFLKQQLNIK